MEETFTMSVKELDRTERLKNVLRKVSGVFKTAFLIQY